MVVGTDMIDCHCGHYSPLDDVHSVEAALSKELYDLCFACWLDDKGIVQLQDGTWKFGTRAAEYGRIVTTKHEAPVVEIKIKLPRLTV